MVKRKATATVFRWVLVACIKTGWISPSHTNMRANTTTRGSFFANGYLKWDECASCKHICPESFWRNYRSYGFGVAYKPCVARGRNHYGNVRIGASAGSDTNRFLGGIHLGYEQNYTLRHGWKLFWQVKTDVMIKGEDLFRTGIVLGVKLPVK